MRTIRSWICCLALTPLLAHASVIYEYEWHNLTPYESAFEEWPQVEFSGSMRFEDSKLIDFDFRGMGYGPKYVELDLLPLDRYLTGRLYASDFEGNVQMSGIGDLWTIEWWGSDNPIAWCAIQGCAGMTGIWRRVDYQVREPDMLLLLLVLLGAAALRWGKLDG